MDLRKLNESLLQSIAIIGSSKVRNPFTGRPVNHRYLRKVVNSRHAHISAPLGEEDTDVNQIANQGMDVKKTIAELIKTSWSGNNESQGKAIELLKGLAFSNDPAANVFMQKIDQFTSSLDPSEFGDNFDTANAGNPNQTAQS